MVSLAFQAAGVKWVRMPQKVTFDTVRKIALGISGVEEGTSYGGLCFKINPKSPMTLLHAACRDASKRKRT